jgi:PAS domain S-box-containing protein
MRDTANRLDFSYIDIPVLRRGTIGAYLLAFVSVGVATALRVAIHPYVEGLQFAMFLPVVIIVTLISGLGAGLLSVLLSVAAVWFFMIPHRLSFYVEHPGYVLSLLLYTVALLFNVGFLSWMRSAVERERDHDALQATKDRMQFALDAALLGWWQYDPLRRMVSGDQRFHEIFDLTADEIPINEIMRRVHPDDAQMGWAALEASLDPVDPKRSATEFRLGRRSGEVRWVVVCGLAHFEGDGRERRAVSMVGTAQDVTESKEREEREHLLMREVNHRAKNMLSVVEAIARQTAARDDPEHFIDRFSERIQALSANQDLLIQNAWQGVEIECLVRAQLAHFADLLDSRIGLSGPKTRLNAAAAQAIGLALHELSTNAGKYGALSTDTGRVDVSWGAADDTFALSWSERGGPPLSAPRRRGFGTLVMQEVAERSLNGKVDLEYASSGVIWRLTCLKTSALEPTV